MFDVGTLAGVFFLQAADGVLGLFQGMEERGVLFRSEGKEEGRKGGGEGGKERGMGRRKGGTEGQKEGGMWEGERR